MQATFDRLPQYLAKLLAAPPERARSSHCLQKPPPRVHRARIRRNQSNVPQRNPARSVATPPARTLQLPVDVLLRRGPLLPSDEIVSGDRKIVSRIPGSGHPGKTSRSLFLIHRLELILRPVQKYAQVIAVHPDVPADRVLIPFLQENRSQ